MPFTGELTKDMRSESNLSANITKWVITNITFLASRLKTKFDQINASLILFSQRILRSNMILKFSKK